MEFVRVEIITAATKLNGFKKAIFKVTRLFQSRILSFSNKYYVTIISYFFVKTFISQLVMSNH